jgi:hypothetical protein
MQLDDLKRIWDGRSAAIAAGAAAPGNGVDRRVARPRPALARYVFRRGIEAACGSLAAVAVVVVVWRQRTEPIYLLAGGGALLYLLAWTVVALVLAAAAQAIDFGERVTDVQLRLARLQLRECRATQWAVLFGVVLWLPLLLLVLEAMVDAPLLAAIDRAWLVANVAFGIVVLWLGGRWARCLGVEPQSPRARWLFELLGDRALARARRELAELQAASGGDSPEPPGSQ